MKQKLLNFIREVFVKPKNAQDSDRIEFIDLGKGIGIFLIILLHMGINPLLTNQIRMPLFFVLSGLVFKESNSFKTLVIKKINTLIIPLLAFNLIEELYFYFEFKYLSSEIPTFDFLKCISMQKINGGGIWYLLTLFEDIIIFTVIYKITKNVYLRALIMFMLLVIGYFILNVSNVFYICSSLFSLPFFYFGCALKGTAIMNMSARKFLRDVILALILLTFMYFYIVRIDNAHIIFNPITVVGYIWNGYLLSFLGVVSIILLCKVVNWLPYFSYIGKYSLIVLCTHVFYVNIIIHLQQKFFSNGIISKVISVLFVAVLCLLTIPVMRKYFPYIVAQKQFLSAIKTVKRKIKLTNNLLN